MNISDPSGEWFLNVGMYPFVDPESGARFEPSIPTKAKATDWLTLQSAIKRIESPLNKPVTKTSTTPAKK